VQGIQLPEVAANLGTSSGLVAGILAFSALVITVLVLRHRGDGDVRVKFGPFEIDRRGSQSRESESKQLPPTEDQGDDTSGV
jgi:hypothetical protein